MKLVFIRHFATKGNLLGKYIGTTDESLEPITQTIDHTKYPKVERVYTSPLKRCMETAELIYPGQTPILCDDFRECDFGSFENKNYLELSGREDYQAWIDSGGTMPFPEGEDPENFKHRCCQEFERVILECQRDQIESVAFVVHGGTIMSILSAFDRSPRTYYDYQVRNGAGYVAQIPKENHSGPLTITLLEEIKQESTR